MNDLISRSTLLEAMENLRKDNRHSDSKSRAQHNSEITACIKRVVEQPTVEAVPVVHGEWRHIGGDEWCCSECGNVISTEGSWEKPTAKFCEECGADMRTSAE